MLRRCVRLLMLVGILTLPSCLVVTCGETRTFRADGAEAEPSPAGPARADSSSGRW